MTIYKPETKATAAAARAKQSRLSKRAGQDLSKSLRRRIYSCGFCELISHLPDGADSLGADDKWFYLDHLKREHGMCP